MKICPECQTQYEEHVEVCLIDGAQLEAPEAAPAPPPEPSGAVSRRAAGGIFGVALFGLIALLLFVTLVGVVLFTTMSGGEPAPPPAPAKAPPPPAPAPPPAPPAPVPVAPVPKIALTSDPPGATVIENGQLVCVTPCTVEHPEEAVLPRRLTFQLDGYKEATLAVTDPTIPQLVKLEPIRRARPKPRPAPPKPTPDPEPRPIAPAPTIGTSR